MLTNDQWAKLVNNNRAKAIGVSWSDEELKAMQSGVSAADIRSGVWKLGEVSVPNETESTTATADVKIPEEPVAKPVAKPKAVKKPVKKVKK